MQKTASTNSCLRVAQNKWTEGGRHEGEDNEEKIPAEDRQSNVCRAFLVLPGLTVNAAKYICVYAQLVRAWMQMLELLIREWYTASICVLLTCVSACLSVEQASCH